MEIPDSMPLEADAAEVPSTLGRKARELLDAVLHVSAQEDLENLYQALVDRARSLTGADSSALHTLDPELSETRVVAVAGAISGMSVNVRVPVGESPPGQIFLTGMPSSASGDLDRTVGQVWASDPIIPAEQIVASIGVPLRSGTQVLAALSVAWRRPRRIDADEIDLLNLLAAHAVPPINALARSEAIAAEADAVRSAHADVSREHAELRHFHDANAKLFEVAMDDLSLEGLAQSAVSLFGGSVTVFDLDERQLAAAGRRAAMPGEALLAEAVAYARDNTTPRVDDATAMVPIRAADRPGAVLIVVGSRALDDSDVRLLERVSALATVLITHDVFVDNASELGRMEFFNDVFDGGGDEPYLPRRAASLGLEMRGPVCVACVSSDLPRKRLAEVTHSAVQPLGGMAATFHGTVVAVVPGEDAEQCAQRTRDAVARSSRHPTLVAAAGPVDDIGAWGSAQKEALRCMHALRSLGRQDGAVSMRSLGFMGLVLGPGSDPQKFVGDKIGPLVAYDLRRSSDLEHTLLTFLDCGSSSVAAATPLHVHLNTVKQRLERIGEILGPGWREPQRLLEIHLALRLRRVLSV